MLSNMIILYNNNILVQESPNIIWSRNKNQKNIALKYNHYPSNSWFVLAGFYGVSTFGSFNAKKCLMNIICIMHKLLFNSFLEGFCVVIIFFYIVLFVLSSKVNYLSKEFLHVFYSVVFFSGMPEVNEQLFNCI